MLREYPQQNERERVRHESETVVFSSFKKIPPDCNVENVKTDIDEYYLLDACQSASGYDRISRSLISKPKTISMASSERLNTVVSSCLPRTIQE